MKYLIVLFVCLMLCGCDSINSADMINRFRQIKEGNYHYMWVNNVEGKKMHFIVLRLSDEAWHRLSLGEERTIAFKGLPE